jgi:hypothetical protein
MRPHHTKAAVPVLSAGRPSSGARLATGRRATHEPPGRAGSSNVHTHLTRPYQPQPAVRSANSPEHVHANAIARQQCPTDITGTRVDAVRRS